LSVPDNATVDVTKIKLRYMAVYFFVQGVVILTLGAILLGSSIPLSLGLGLVGGFVQVAILFYIGRSGMSSAGW
jgi:hypothetical protein